MSADTPHTNHRQLPDRVDVAVIGGGLAGLTAAAFAARAGRSVAVFERKSSLGGRAGTENRDGFLFNQGAHALYIAGAGVDTLKELGISPRGAKAPLGGMGRRGGELGSLPSGPASLATSPLLSPRGKGAMAKAFARLPLVKADRFDGVTLREWVDAYTRNEEVREILHALGRLASYANAPDLVSAGAVIRQLQGGLKGVLYLDDGWAQLVEALDVAARAAGAAVHTGCRIDTVTPDGGRHGLSIAGPDGVHECTAESVIVAGLAPAHVSTLLELPADSLAHAGPAVEASVLDLSLDAEPDHRFVLGIDEPTYFSLHSPPAAMAPEGCAAAVAMKYLPVGEQSDLDTDRHDLEAIAASAGVGQALDRRFLRAMTVTGGLPTAEHGGPRGRPSTRLPERPGVYLAGDWVGETGMLADTAFASARQAGEAAAAHVAGVEVAA